MRRRAFIATLGSAAVWPLVARAQQPRMRVVGLLSGTQAEDRLLGALREGLHNAGFDEGRDVAIKYRSADGRFDRLPALASELVADAVDVIVAILSPTTVVAAKAATQTIPIVFALGADPVEIGLVSSLNRPGGNITGVVFVNTLGAKRLELLRELVPAATVIGFLINPANPTTDFQTEDIRAAARQIGVELSILKASREHDINAAFTSFVEQPVNAVVVGTDAFFLSRRDQLVGLAARHAMPTIYYVREFALAGGLVSYGASILDAFRLAGSYTARVLKGERPADLPIQQTVKLELVINLKTAAALGLTVPPSLLARADEVIE
jgi:putative tryptophan/tyrosine transport system substrate-binding protein